MRAERLDGSAGPRAVARAIRGLVPGAESVAGAVAAIIARVRAEGDAALRELTRSLDTGGAEPLPLRATPAEGRRALAALDPAVVAALEVARANVGAVARAWLSQPPEVRLPEGHRVVLREQPVAAAGVYVPGGRAPYPSTVVMGVETARAAGVADIAVCAPPGPAGDVHPAILAACALCGGVDVYRVGGAQAVAAMAYGTETVPRRDVIVGPGNLWVQEAKRQVSGAVGIDGFAGPTDVLVLADGAARPRLVALDMLAQAEHGRESLAVAVSPSRALLDAVAAELEARPDEDGLGVGVLVDVADLEAGLAVAEELAAEHLQLMGPGAEALAPRVRRAGCLFVGPCGATAFGDYVAGSNHVLPTGGAARFASTLSPAHFRRRMAEVHIPPAAAAALARAAAPLARAEGFEVHAASMEARMSENREP